MEYDGYFLSDLRDISDPVVAGQLLRASQSIYIRKNTVIIETGEVQSYIPFLRQGIVRGYLLDADGRDITDCFVHRPGSIIMACNAPGTPAHINMETMTDCEITAIPLIVVASVLDTNLELMKIYNRYLVAALESHWEGKMIMHRYSAMERYKWFLYKYPGLIDRVSNKHIASFLGMTPVTLSRLRRRVREEEQGFDGCGNEAGG